MNKADFNPKVISKNLKDLMSEQKNFIFEFIYALVPFLFLGLIWLPFFSVRTAAPTHFLFTDHGFLFWIVYLIVWLAAYALYIISRLTVLKPFSIITYVFLVAIEALYIVATLEMFGTISVFFAGVFNVALNVGFYLVMLHFIGMVVLAFIPKVIHKALDEAYTKEAAKPAPEPKEEPKPEVKEEPKPEPQPEPKPEVKEEPKPEPKPAAKKKPKPEPKPE